MQRVKAATAALLWFALAVSCWQILVSFADVPRGVGPILGIGAALWISGVVMRGGRSTPARPARTASRSAIAQELQTGR
jgi:hypothetical protein